MKKAIFILKAIMLIACLLLVLTAKSQTRQYTRIETTHFKGDNASSRTIRYEGGTIDIDGTSLTIDKEAPKPQYYTLVSKGTREPEDENYYSVTYWVSSETKAGKPRVAKCVLMYSPKHELVDVIIKNGRTNVDYVFKD